MSDTESDIPQHYPTINHINTAIIRGTEDEALAFLKKYLVQVDTVDSFGRTALHIAASCGKLKVVKFLLAKGANINKPDLESLYTPLHRAIFYAKINIAIYLIKKGASLNSLDGDGNSPLTLECLSNTKKKYAKCRRELFVWGSNLHYNLGQVNGNSIEIPRRLKFPLKNDNYVTDVAMNKYHSVFVTRNGTAFACGMGRKLQLGFAQDLVCVPQRITGLRVKKVALGLEHSIFLTEDNNIWVCGCNGYYQLGLRLVPYSTTLQQILPAFPSNFVSNTVIGVAAARYHSCFWTKDVLFTFGLNAGQLGHLESERTIREPTIVSSLLLNSEIILVATSDAAIVVAFKSGKVVCLHEYKTRIITSRGQDIVKICCHGGTLYKDNSKRADADDWHREYLQIMILYSDGRLYYWEENHLRRLSLCTFVRMRGISIKDVCLHKDGFLITTDMFEAYHGTFLARSNRRYKKDKFLIRAFLCRIPLIRRARSVFCDNDGCNFGATQFHPRNFNPDESAFRSTDLLTNRKSLLDDCTENDRFTDVVFLVNGKRFPAHSVIVGKKSNLLSDIICVKRQKIHTETGSRDMSSASPEIELCLDPNLFKEILTYMYVDVCNLTVGNFQINSYQFFNQPVFSGQSLNDCRDELTKYKKQFDTIGSDFREIAYSLGLPLYKEIIFKNNHSCMRSELKIKRDFMQYCKEKWCHNSMDSFHDVQFNCGGVLLKAHKCILASSSEYFATMFGMGGSSSWLETTTTNAIDMPFNANAFKVLLNYFYKGNVESFRETSDINLVCDVMALSCQCLLGKLQEICEHYLVCLVNLENCVALLLFADCFHAELSKKIIFDFMLENMDTLLETRLFEELPQKLIDELSNRYTTSAGSRKFVLLERDDIAVQKHNRLCQFYEEVETKIIVVAEKCVVKLSVIKPSTCLPSHKQLANVLLENSTVAYETEDDWLKEFDVKSFKSPKRHRRRYSGESLTGRSRTSSCSTLSSVSDHEDHLLEEDEEFTFSGLDEKYQLLGTDEWKTVERRKKRSQVATTEELDQNNEIKSTIELTLQNALDALLAKISLPERSPPTLPPVMQDSDVFPSIAEAAGRKTSSVVKMPKMPAKSHRRTSSAEGAMSLPEPSVQKQSAWKTVDEGDPVEPVDFRCSEAESERSISRSDKTSHLTRNKLRSEQSFSAILEEEKLQADNLKKQMSKSLSMIQLEDKAMAELLEYYGGAYNPEEEITVERVIAPTSKPTWGP